MPLSEHVDCVVVTFKMTEWGEQEICIKFYWNLNMPPQNLFGWLRRPQLWTTGDWQLHHNSVPAHISHLVQSFLAKYEITQVTQPATAHIWCPVTSGFFQNWNHLWNGRDFRLSEIQENMMGQLMETGRTVWGPKVPTLKGTEASLSYIQGFLYLCFSINASIFHIAWLDTFWTDLVFVNN